MRGGGGQGGGKVGNRLIVRDTKQNKTNKKQQKNNKIQQE